MPKKKSIKTIDKKLWKLFSEYIRKRDCLASTGSTDRGACFTCDNVTDYKKLQAGHYIPRQIRNIRYDERNVRAQCYACNMFYGGMTAEYGDRIGEDANILLELQRKYRAGEHKAPKYDWYEEQIEVYKDKIKDLDDVHLDYDITELTF